MFGDLKILNSENQSVDFCTTPVSIFEHLTNYEFVQTNAKCVLIVEKDSIFQRLMDEGFTKQFPQVILVTVKINFLIFFIYYF